MGGIELVNRIDSLLKERQLNRKDLCEKLNIKTSTMATWKTKDIMPTAEHIIQLHVLLDVSIDYLMLGHSGTTSDDYEQGFREGVEFVKRNVLNLKIEKNEKKDFIAVGKDIRKPRTCKELVEIINNYRKEKKLSLRQFSVLVGIPHSTILTWKKKNTLPSIEVISKIASIMNVSLDWFVNNEAPVNQEKKGNLM